QLYILICMGVNGSALGKLKHVWMLWVVFSISLSLSLSLSRSLSLSLSLSFARSLSFLSLPLTLSFTLPPSQQQAPQNMSRFLPSSRHHRRPSSCPPPNKQPLVFHRNKVKSKALQNARSEEHT